MNGLFSVSLILGAVAQCFAKAVSSQNDALSSNNSEVIPVSTEYDTNLCLWGKNCSVYFMTLLGSLQRQLPAIPDNLLVPCRDDENDFPHFFTENQRDSGAVAVNFLIGIYCFTILAIICDNYFLPCVERICEFFKLSHNVAAATFMACATSAPELFVNLIGTFITESDIGIGTVVGSSMFNTLGVAALGGLFASKPIKVDWYPVTRDVFLYVVSVVLLVIVTWDGKIMLYEGLTLFIVYFLYFILMFQNERISKKIKSMFNVSQDNKAILSTQSSSSSLAVSTISKELLQSVNSTIISVETPQLAAQEPEVKPPKSWQRWIYDVYTAPIRFALFCTVPDPKKRPHLFPFTFFMCVIWIGSNSYMVSWQITLIGETFGINDAVLGLTFLAAGGCLPEAISICIMSRKGEGSMGVSNALGANTMNILLSLGMPWFIKILVLGAHDTSFIRIDSGAMEYTILSLIVVALALYFTLYCSDFHLSKITGCVLFIAYIIFIVLAVLSELVFFKTKRPTCV